MQLATGDRPVPVWIPMSDVVASGSEEVRVLVPLPLPVIYGLWRAGRGQTCSGGLRLAPDGRLDLAVRDARAGSPRFVRSKAIFMLGRTALRRERAEVEGEDVRRQLSKPCTTTS